MKQLTENALKVLEARYLLRGDAGKIVETPDQLFRRVATAIAAVEKTQEDREKWAQIFYDMMSSLDFLPNTPTLVNAGNPKGSSVLSACFVLPVKDSLDSIFDTLHRAAMLHQGGAGTGYSFSELRPANSVVSSRAGVSSGPISFMRVYNAAVEEIKQGGVRRGAQMNSLSCTHPDILQFIRCKRDLSQITNANISVEITDAFMEAVESDSDWVLSHPKSLTTVTVKAKELWNEILESAWQTGDPGCLFVDEANRHNSTPHVGKFATTNPCLQGDTLVFTADGRGNVPIKTLAAEGRDVPVFCLDENKKVAIRTMRNPRITGRSSLLKITLDDNSVIKVTPNHKFLLKSGEYREASSLVAGDSLRILTRYESSLKDVFKEKNLNQDYLWLNNEGSNEAEHRLIASYSYNTPIPPGFVVHHRDRNARNNAPTNLEIMSREDHVVLHSSQMIGDNNPMRRAKREWSATDWKEYSENMSEAVKEENNGRFSGFTNEQLRSEALLLTKSLGRRFTAVEWQKHASTKSLPQAFSGWRKSHLNGGIAGLAKWAALELGLEYVDIDPCRVLHYRAALLEGYDAELTEQELLLHKKCEVCDKTFTTNWYRREHGICSTRCAARRATNTPERLSALRSYSLGLKEKTQRDQLEVFLNTKEALGREPSKKEWVDACKKTETPFVIGKTSSFKKWADIVDAASFYNHRVISITTEVGEEDVYNGTVDDFHNFFVGGFEGTTSNGKKKFVYLNNLQCGEIFLLPNEACNLGSINLINFVLNADDKKSFDFERFKTTVHSAVRFLDNVIEASNLPFEDMNQMMRNNRKIGLGIMGWADLLISMGVKYDSQEALDFAGVIGGLLNDEAAAASAVLGKIKGNFPNYPGSVYDNPATPYMRNCDRTCIAPTGSISLIANETSSGIEPVFAFNHSSNRINTKLTHSHWFAKQWSEKYPGETLPDYCIEANKVDPTWHVKMQAAWQKNINLSISKTVNLPNSATREDISSIYKLAWKLKCKGITVYRDGCRATGQVLESKETSGTQPEETKTVLPTRAFGQSSKYYEMRTGSGPLHVHIDHHEDTPYRVFVNMPPIGTEISGMAAILGVVVSKYLELGGDLKALIKHFQSVTSDRAIGLGQKKVLSVPHALSTIFKDFLKVSNGEEIVVAPVAVESLSCPECYSSQFKKQEGCSLCYNCGYSTCS